MSGDWIRDPRDTPDGPTLDPADCADDPADQFAAWFADARTAAAQPDAMVLATADASGQPSARAVLLKRQGADGLVFFTNRGSRKGHDLAANPAAAVCFVWYELHRQVRAEGRVDLLPDADADAYWAERSPRSQAGSAASPQSRPIPDRASLVDAAEAWLRVHPDGGPRPTDNVLYVLTPHRWEFWQGRPDRLHDRVEYELGPDGWERRRLAP